MLFYPYLAQLRQADLPVFQADVAVHTHRAVGSSVAALALELRIAGLLSLEEAREGVIQMPQALLEGDAVHFLLQYICG